VHLSRDIATATKVGQRHGRPGVLTLRAREMSAAGHPFFLSANDIWLTQRVPVSYLIFPEA
jgi:putative RNA 2'-phosphotransferase